MRRNRSKLVAGLATLALAVTAFTACGTAKTTESKAESSEVAGSGEATSGAQAEAANPWMDVRDLKEALKETGVALEAPEEIGDFHLSHVQAVRDGGMVQVFYGGVADQTETQVLLRKAKSTEDISGDYTVYPEDHRADTAAGELRLRGQDGRVYLATWQRGDYSYSLSLAQGMEEAKVMEVISEIK
jgi:hypothetical protein